MPELALVQRDFVAAVRDGSDIARAASWLAGHEGLVARRLAIYRANLVAGADKALAGTYPVIRQAVGEEFFHGLAREYQRARPSTSGDLAAFGQGFPEFLTGFVHARHLPWLPDLARLEWAAQVAYGAADGTTWDASALAGIPPEIQPRLRFDWTPGTAVVESEWPIARVWTIHQPEFDGAFEVDWAVPERALVWREGWRVKVAPIGLGEAVFIARSLSGTPLGAATVVALEADAAFDLGALLARAVAGRLIQGFTLDSTP